MRPVVDGMTRTDDIILSELQETGYALPPKVLSVNVDRLAQSTVQRRLTVLERAGLVEQDGPLGYRRITELGERYLKGDVTDEEVAGVEAALEDSD